MKTLLVILTTSECKQNAVSALGARERSARAVTTRGTQWKRRESASNRQLERCRNAIELRRIAKVAVRLLRKRHENPVTSPS